MKEKKYLQIKENGACSIFWDFAMFYKIPKQKLTKHKAVYQRQKEKNVKSDQKKRSHITIRKL